jgi:hypothetical protein
MAACASWGANLGLALPVGAETIPNVCGPCN